MFMGRYSNTPETPVTSFVSNTNTRQQWGTLRRWYTCFSVYGSLSDSGTTWGFSCNHCPRCRVSKMVFYFHEEDALMVHRVTPMTSQLVTCSLLTSHFQMDSDWTGHKWTTLKTEKRQAELSRY